MPHLRQYQENAKQLTMNLHHSLSAFPALIKTGLGLIQQTNQRKVTATKEPLPKALRLIKKPQENRLIQM